MNVWATWCTPCIEEMSLVGKWRETLSRDEIHVAVELMSIDEREQEAELKKWQARGLPGQLTWVKSTDDFPGWLEKSAGLSPDSAIPIHFFVDPAGKLRCARVGAVHAQDYGAIRALLRSSP